MALQRQTIELPLIKGLDQKTDPKQTPIGKLQFAQNVVFNKPGRVEKRNGFTGLSKDIIDTNTTITDGQAVMNYKGELIAFDKQNAYSYVQGTDKWKDKGDFVSTTLGSTPITNPLAQDSRQDSARHSSGIEIVVYTRLQAGALKAYYTISDTNTGQTIVRDRLISNDGRNPKVVVFDSAFIIYYWNAADSRIYKGVLPVGNINATVTYSAITSAGSTVNSATSDYSVAVMNTRGLGKQIYLTFTNGDTTGGEKGQTIRRYISPSATTQATQTDFQRFDTATAACNLFYDPYHDGVGLLFGEFTYIQIKILSPNLIDGAGNADVVWFYQYDLAAYGAYHMSAVSKYRDTFELILFEDGMGIGGCSSINLAKVVTGKWSRLSVNLASNAFMYGDKAYIVVSAGPQGYGAAYYLVSEDCIISGRWYADQAILTENYRYLTSVNMVDDNTFDVALMFKTAFAEINGTDQIGLYRTTMDFYERQQSYSRGELGDNLYIGGGQVKAYDGVSFVEDGFAWNPSGSLTVQSPGTGSTYGYCFTYQWIDNWGNIHESAPSVPIFAKTSNPIGVSGSVVTASVLTLTLTEKAPLYGRSNVMIVAYRSQAAAPEGPYYQLPVSSSNSNNISGYYITLPVDNVPDSQLNNAGSPPLYTTGELPNYAPPPLIYVTSYRNRLFGLDSTNPLTIYFSKEVRPGIPVQWVDSFFIQVDPKGGPVTGLVGMDDKLIIFKDTSVRFISGQGPTADGANNDFNAGTLLITADAGCSEPRSIVTTPEGIIFKSKKGIYLLNRGLQVSYIGNPVEDFNDVAVTSAVLIPTQNQVRLTLENDVVLVYDYFVGQWATFTNIQAVDSIIWEDKHTFIRADGTVLDERAGVYTDNGSIIPMKIQTTWLGLSGIQGFQRLFRFYILGGYRSPHQFSVKLNYDFNENYTQQIIVSPETVGTYGSEVYGLSGSYYGGEYAVYQWDVRPERQKCMNMRVTIEDLPSSGSLEAGADISNLRFEYGVEGKGNRLRKQQIVG